MEVFEKCVEVARRATVSGHGADGWMVGLHELRFSKLNDSIR